MLNVFCSLLPHIYVLSIFITFGTNKKLINHSFFENKRGLNVPFVRPDLKVNPHRAAKREDKKDSNFGCLKYVLWFSV